MSRLGPSSPRLANDARSSASASVRLTGRVLLLGRMGWLLAAVLVLGLDILGTPVAYHQAMAACVGNACGTHQLTPDQVRGLVASGMSISAYAVYTVALYWLGTLVYAGIALVIFLRRSDDRMALFGAFALLVFGAGPVFGALNSLSDQSAVWSPVIDATLFLGVLAFYVFFCIFPSGHFAPGWMRWVALSWAIGDLTSLIPYAPLQSLVNGPIPFAATFGLLVAAQVYRYRKVSTPIQREQTKWVVAGFAFGLGGFLVTLGATNIGLGSKQLTTALGIVGVDTALALFLCLIPIYIGIAILRSRLWDIDVLINRTLVYGSLTAILAGIYFACVAAAQFVVEAMSGQTQQQPVIIVASTLLAVALFQPLRRRTQSVIDRRFYRRKYDAAKTLAAFSATLRQQVDLNELSAHLVSVVQETMQPARVSLWLLEPEFGREVRQTQGDAKESQR